MNLLKSLSCAVLLSASVQLHAQTPQPIQAVEHTPTGCKLKWDNVTGRTYFIEWSLDLNSWQFFNEIEHDEPDYEFNFMCSTDKMFLRLVYTDVPMSNPETHDLDGDGIGNLAEISDPNNQTHPGKLDTDGNGTDDGGLTDRDGDGIPTAYEIANGLDPLVANSAADLANYLASLTTTTSSLEVFTHLK